MAMIPCSICSEKGIVQQGRVCSVCNGTKIVDGSAYEMTQSHFVAVYRMLVENIVKMEDLKSSVTDALDKCNDILDKCNDIFEKVNE